MGVPVKGLQGIRSASTLRGMRSESGERHVLQFRLAALELERTRRHREKSATERRLSDLNARLADIDTLIRRQQKELALAPPVESDQMPGGRAATRPKSEVRRVLRY